MDRDRGPDDYEWVPEVNYHESGWEKWILGVVAVLLAAGVVGLWNINARLASVESTQTSQQRQLDRIEDRLVPRGANAH